MNTEEACEELVQRYNGWNYDGDHGVLRFYREAHNILMTQECAQLLILDDSTGTLPILATTAGVFAYDMPTTVWKVSSILVSTDNQSLIDYGVSRVQRSFRNSIIIGGLVFARWPYVAKPQEYRSSTYPAKVVFSQDPGTTTNKFYRQSYRRPTQILSLNIEADIGSPYIEEFLIPAAGKLIEGQQSGNYVEAYQAVLKEFKPRLAAELNRSFGGDDDDGPVGREF